MASQNFQGTPASVFNNVSGVSEIPRCPPPIGIVDPLFVISAASLLEMIETALNKMLSRQDRLIRDQYESITNGYIDMNKKFEDSIRQTDKIIAEQGSRFELKLQTIESQIRQSHTIAAPPTTRPDIPKFPTSREDLELGVSKIIHTTLSNKFDDLAAVFKDRIYCTYSIHMNFKLTPHSLCR
jgi:hypothetical protein